MLCLGSSNSAFIMAQSLKLSHKAAILVGVPIGLMLIFLLTLFILFQKVEREASEVDHSKTIISSANSMVKQYYDAASQLLTFKHTRDDEERQKFQEKIKRTNQNLAELRNLMGDDRVEVKQLEKLQKISLTGMDLMSRYERHIAGEERLSELEVGLLYKQLDMVGAAFTAKLEELVAHETSKHRINSAEEARTRAFVKAWILFGVAAAIGIGAFLTINFNRSTTSRLGLLMDNTLRLSRKEELLPELAGDDEISQLDRTFHQMAKDLAEATRKERAILDNAVDVICSISKDSIFSAMNPASQQVWGIQPEQLIGKHVSDLLFKDDVEKFKDGLEKNRGSAVLFNLENRVLASDGRPIFTLWSIRWSEEEQSFFCVAHDITDRKEVERLKQEFVAVVSHELRTPLTSLEMTLDLLLNGTYGPITPVAEKRIKGAEVGISRLILLINDLLDMEKMEAGKLSMKFRNVCFAEIVERAIESVRGFAELQGVRLKYDGSADERDVYADPDRIVQVIVNLLSNAIKFSDDDSEVELVTFVDGTFAELRVIDHGSGIPEGYEEAIFEKYSQAHSSSNKRTKGTGLGLPICRAIVQAHRGEIAVRATDGGGSTFWFKFPIHAESKSKNETAELSDESSRKLVG